MFFSGQQGGATLVGGSGSTGPIEAFPPPHGLPQEPRSMDCWLAIVVPNIFFFISLFMNATCFAIMLKKSQCTFTTPLNLLMMIFLLTMSIYSLNNMVCSILGEVLSMETGHAMMMINQIGDLFSSYFSIILLFLIGMNRDAVYSNPWLVKNFFPRKRLIFILIALAAFSLALSILVYNRTGMSRTLMDTGVYEDYVTNLQLMTICSYVSYFVALSSCIFYIRVYYYLRKQREGVVHNKTRAILNKAEELNCRQGVFVLFIYSFSLIIFIISQYMNPNGDFGMIIHGLQEVVQSLPSLAIPLALFCFCKEMQGVLLYTLTGGKKGQRCKKPGRFSADSNGRRTTLTAVSTVTSL